MPPATTGMSLLNSSAAWLRLEAHPHRPPARSCLLRSGCWAMQELPFWQPGEAADSSNGAAAKSRRGSGKAANKGNVEAEGAILLYCKWRIISACVVPGLHSHPILSPLGCLSMMKAAVSHDKQISCIVWGAVCFP